MLTYNKDYIVYADGNGDGKGLVAIRKEPWSNITGANIYSRKIVLIVQPKESYYPICDCVSLNKYNSLCSVCEYNSSVTAHSFKSQSDNNSHWNSCSVCSYNTDKINHKLTYQKDDTSHWLKCTDCGHSTDAAKHTFGEWNIITNPTEESKGEKDRICSECSHKEIAEIPPLNHVHSYVSHVTPPSCTSEGLTTHTCTCGDTYIDEKTAMVDHTSDGIWQSDDNSHWNTCSECNQMINISSHEESEWIIDMEAYVEVEGKKHTECLICKVILANETIAAITPSESDTEPKETEIPDESEESEKATVSFHLIYHLFQKHI